MAHDRRARTGYRILMVTARYLPFTGGTETHVHEVATRLSRLGHSVTILTSDPTGRLPPRETVANLTVIRVRAWPRHGDLYFAPAVFREAAMGKWDLMHIQGYHTFVAPFGMIAAVRSAVPFVLTFHSGGHSSRLRNAARGIQSRVLRPLVMRAARLIAVSKFEADAFSRHMGVDRDSFEVVPNGAELPPAAPSALDDGEALVVSVGRLERYKGHHRAITAMPRLLEQVPNARLRIVGRGPYEAELRKLTSRLGLENRVTIAGVPPGDRTAMASLLSNASLLVLLSDYEAHPVAVMEGLSVGLPAVVTATSGLAELADRNLALAVPLDAGPEVIAGAMARRLAEPRTAAPSVKLPNWDGCTDRIQAIYRSVIDRCDPALTETARC